MEFQAQYNDGQTARTLHVRVVLEDEGLRIQAQDGAPIAEWPRDTFFFVDGRRATGPLRLGRRDGDMARLTFAAPDARPAILARYPDAARHRALTFPVIRKIVAWTAVSIAGVALVVWVVIPAAAVQIAAMIPQSVQSEVGKRVAEQVIGILALVEHERRDSMICTGADGQAALEALVARLAANAPPGFDFDVRVVDTKVPNAMALPGGHILVLRGIIEFVDGPNELAGVLAHEMGHVVSNHSAENMIKVGGVTALFSMLVGDISGGAVIIAVGNAAIQGSYGQEAEREADAFAVDLLNKGQLDGEPFLTFFTKLAKYEKQRRPMGDSEVLDWMSSHPPTKERADAIRPRISSGGQVLTDKQWQALRNICG